MKKQHSISVMMTGAAELPWNPGRMKLRQRTCDACQQTQARAAMFPAANQQCPVIYHVINDFYPGLSPDRLPVWTLLLLTSCFEL
mmetsp:Transcript_103212/g.174801  ORF Transcript_103212/g.174801 Transcript_103212/m.174801 type:complete len:85 (+) Transcript_103212:401-655(+)